MYVAFFLPTSINAAWLSVASGLGVLIVPVSHGSTAYVEAEAVILAMVVTAAGKHRFGCTLCTGRYPQSTLIFEAKNSGFAGT